MKRLKAFLRAVWLAWITTRAVKDDSIDADAYLKYLANLCGMRIVGRIAQLGIQEVKDASVVVFLHTAWLVFRARKSATLSRKNEAEAGMEAWSKRVFQIQGFEQKRMALLRKRMDADSLDHLLNAFPPPSKMLQENKDIVFAMAERLPSVLGEAQQAFALHGRPEANISPEEFYILCRAISKIKRGAKER